jgi:hypothetical protein
VNRVEAFTSTAAESTAATKRWAWDWESVTMASECEEECSRMWVMAASRDGTTAAEISSARYSVPQSSSVAGTTPGS